MLEGVISNHLRKAPRCGVRETPGDGGSRQCLRIAGHKQGECQFEDGEAAMKETEASGQVRIVVSDDLLSLGILVVVGGTAPDANADFNADFKVGIIQDGARIAVFRSPVGTGEGIDKMAEAVTAVGGKVSFGVGTIYIESRAAWYSRTNPVV